MITLRDAIGSDQVALDLRADTPRAAIAALASRAANAAAVADASRLESELLAKADLDQQTELAPGIWLPHLRVRGVNGVVVAAGRWATPTRFPWSEEPVRLAFLVAASRSAVTDYQRVVGELARRLQDDDRLRRLLEVEDADAFVKTLLSDE